MTDAIKLADLDVNVDKIMNMLLFRRQNAGWIHNMWR
jgi:hypothetical protein